MGRVQNERAGVQIDSPAQNMIEKRWKRKRENVTQQGVEKERREGEVGKGGWMLPGHSSRWCLKCFGGLFPLLSLLMSFLCSCLFYTPCDGR